MNRIRPWTMLVVLGALGGFFFASYSTYDFVAHLDRQVHGIHCSFLPGLDQTDVSGSSGCHTTLMSPYSSVFRTSTWGGLPVALPAMGVFAFLLFFAAALPIVGRERDERTTLFLMLGTLLPVLTSIGMGYLSIVTLDAACKLCIGIYVSSFVAFVGAFFLWIGARRTTPPEDHVPVSVGKLAAAFGIGVAFVGLPAVVYAAGAPDFERYIGECGELAAMPSEGMLVPLGPQNRDVQVVEVFDPLCPACRGFEQRFGAQDAAGEVNRQVLLFPLDDACNWMVDDAIHAGACAISEAILCADDSPDVTPEEVIEWAFSEQEAIRTATELDPDAAADRARQRFASLATCIGSPPVRARLNMGLRYAVENQMPIITPQVFVNGVRMCDEDTDLGMDFALRRLVDKARSDGVRAQAPRREPVLAAPAAPPTRPNSIQLRPQPRDSLDELREAAAEVAGGEPDTNEPDTNEPQVDPEDPETAPTEPAVAPSAAEEVQ